MQPSGRVNRRRHLLTRPHQHCLLSPFIFYDSLEIQALVGKTEVGAEPGNLTEAVRQPCPFITMLGNHWKKLARSQISYVRLLHAFCSPREHRSEDGAFISRYAYRPLKESQPALGHDKVRRVDSVFQSIPRACLFLAPDKFKLRILQFFLYLKRQILASNII